MESSTGVQAHDPLGPARLSHDDQVMDSARGAVVEWLLQGDAAIRWQALADVVSAPAEVVQRERSKTATSGWGRRLLEHQDARGTWAGGLYSPKWTSTTYTLALLRRLGLPSDNSAARRGAQVPLDEGKWVDGGIVFWKTSKPGLDLAVVGMVVTLASYFGLEDDRVHEMVHLEQAHFGTTR